MTDEERKAKNREKMRRYRLRHANDPTYKARIRKEKRRQRAKNPDTHKEGNRRRQARYQEKHKDTPEFKAKAAERTRQWRARNKERAAKARDEWKDRNRERVVIYLRDWRKANPDYRPKSVAELSSFYAAERRARKNAAMPQWADKAAINAVYRAAKQMSEQTGMLWHVDHIVPLKHKLVCGLHVAQNLQILPALENVSKGNRFNVA